MRQPEFQTQFLSNKICALLTHKKSRRVRVRSQVVLKLDVLYEYVYRHGYRRGMTYRADTQVDTLQVLRAVDAETFVNDTALLTRFHGAGTERVPCRLDVVLIKEIPNHHQSLRFFEKHSSLYIPEIQSSIALSSSSVYLIFSWTLLGSYGSDGLDQVPMWIPTVRPSGNNCFAVLMSISFVAAGEAGWKWG